MFQRTLKSSFLALYSLYFKVNSSLLMHKIDQSNPRLLSKYHKYLWVALNTTTHTFGKYPKCTFVEMVNYLRSCL